MAKTSPIVRVTDMRKMQRVANVLEVGEKSEACMGALASGAEQFFN
jgi:hypothetical protein